MRAAIALCGVLAAFTAACSTAYSIGEPSVAREAIVGGVRDVGDPTVVLLVSYPPDQSTFVTCTASVIAPRLLVTAAHCVDAANHPSHVYGVFTGDDASSYATVAQIAPALLPVSAVHPHPDYDPAPPFVADIGIVELVAAVAIAPLPIARDPLPTTLPGQAARLVGYGQTTYQTYNAKKYAAATTVASLPGDDTVVVGDSLRHSCLGDSGGPALVALGGKETIIGVDSFTDTSGCTQPAHYRRVDLYLPFIDAYLPATTTPDLGAADLAHVDAAVAPDAGIDAATGDLDVGGCAMVGRAQGNFVAIFVMLLFWLLSKGRTCAPSSSSDFSSLSQHPRLPRRKR